MRVSKDTLELKQTILKECRELLVNGGLNCEKGLGQVYVN